MHPQSALFCKIGRSQKMAKNLSFDQNGLTMRLTRAIFCKIGQTKSKIGRSYFRPKWLNDACSERNFLQNRPIQKILKKSFKTHFSTFSIFLHEKFFIKNSKVADFAIEISG
jgi:hypothetical protein